MAKIFKNAVKNLKTNQKIRRSGGIIGIPFSPNYNKLNSVVPGIQRSRYYIVTANSKVGKSQIADDLFVYSPLEYVIENSPENIDLKIFYFSLEMSKEMKIATMMANKLYKDYGISISVEMLQSQFKEYVLEDHVLEKIEAMEEYFEKMENIVEFVDDIKNPYGIYKYVRDYLNKNGEFTKKTVKWEKPDGTFEEKEVRDEYVPNNKGQFVIVLVDHVSLLKPEKGQQGIRDAIGKWSSDHCLELRDKYKCAVVNVQQQAADSEKKQYTFKGDSIVDKVKPTPDGLGENKTTQRDCDLMLGLFAPHRYGIDTYNGYQILNSETALRDNYRELIIMLNRRGISNASIDLFFNGACNLFKELPKPDHKDMNIVKEVVSKLRNPKK